MDSTSADASTSPSQETDLESQLDDDAVLATFRRRFRESQAHFADWRTEARSLYDLVAGRQWDDDALAKLKDEDRPAVTFNVAGKYMDSVQGLQINNRQDIKYAPREPGDVRSDELLTGTVTWGRDLSCMADDETDAFYDCILTGCGWMEGYIDKDLDSGGVPAGSRVDPLEVYPDPLSRQRNYQDGRYVIRVKWVDHLEYKETVGDKESDSAIPDFASLEAEDPDGIHVIETPQDYQNDNPNRNAPSRKRRPIADYQWWQREDALRVTTQQFGNKEFSTDEWRAVEPLLIKAQVEYKTEKFRRKAYFRAIVAGATVVQNGRNPYQGGFTFHGITGKRDRNKRVWYGIGRTIQEPQMWVNKFFSTILYALMTNAKGGLMAEENTFKDARKAESEWSNPNSITWLKEGALQKGKIQPKPPAAYPQGLDRLMEFSLNALPQTSGLNTELLGLADRVQSGVLEAQRKQSAMAIIAWAFDAMRRYYRSMGRMLAVYVKDYVPEGTLIQVSGESGKQYVPLLKKQLSPNFDVIVDEAPTSVNMQERVWVVLQTIIPQMLQAGMAIPKEVLDYSPLPADLVQKWKEALAPDPKKQAISDQTVKATLEKLIAEVAKTNAGAALDTAKAHEIEQQLGGPQGDPQAEQKMELVKARMEGSTKQQIAAQKINRDANTKLTIAQMNTASDERMATLNAALDARLEKSQQELDAATRIAVAKISAASKPQPRNAS